MDFSEYNALGEILHTSWGKSSSKTGLFSVKGRFVGENQVKLIYTTIINLVSDRELDLMKRKYSEESDDIIKQAVTNIKKEYKEKTGKSLKMKEKDSQVTLEIINSNIYNRKRTAYLRRFVTLEVG